MTGASSISDNLKSKQNLRFLWGVFPAFGKKCERASLRLRYCKKGKFLPFFFLSIALLNGGKNQTEKGYFFKNGKIPEWFLVRTGSPGNVGCAVTGHRAANIVLAFSNNL